jgi:hypothetical protein
MGNRTEIAQGELFHSTPWRSAVIEVVLIPVLSITLRDSVHDVRWSFQEPSRGDFVCKAKRELSLS